MCNYSDFNLVRHTLNLEKSSKRDVLALVYISTYFSLVDRTQRKLYAIPTLELVLKLASKCKAKK